MMDSIMRVNDLLDEWNEVDVLGGDVTSILNRLAKEFECETEAFYRQDPDPFDDRHPSRCVPDSTLGQILKCVFRNPRIVDEMIKVYCQRDDTELNTAVCRFLLNLLPGLESVIFHEEAFVLKLFQWAEFAQNPLQSYATGLLGAAMEVPEIASNYREKNAFIVPLMLKRLYKISTSYLRSSVGDSHLAFSNCKENNSKEGVIPSFSAEGINKKNSKKMPIKHKGIAKSARHNPLSTEDRERGKNPLSTEDQERGNNPLYIEDRERRTWPKYEMTPLYENIFYDTQTWSEHMLGVWQVYPLTYAAQQRYIFQYLTPMGEYQELIGHVFEESALTLTLKFIDLEENPDVRLAFEALKYLASLLNHKKIALEFLNIGGLQILLKVPRSSIAAAGVSFCLYYLGYLEEALEKISMSSSKVITDLVSFALGLLEGSHDSSRCHATLFFSFAFRFKSLLRHFDLQDGLRKLFNVMSTLEVFVKRDRGALSDDEIYGDRITTKHVCASFKKYFEAHLAVLVAEKRKKIEDSLSIRSSQSEILMCEAVEKNIQTLHDLSLVPIHYWKPVNVFVDLDGITFLLELISSYLETGISGRTETVKHCLDVLKICALAEPTVLKFCEKILVRNFQHITGISVLLQAAEVQIPSAEVQRSALHAIINCVCSKVTNGEGGSRTIPKRRITRHEEILNKVWKSVRIKNGIMVLINLLPMKVPVTDADCIRALACRALCGLARSQNVQQIISKLPLITDGQLTDLMKEPVLQDKYHHHVQFCKYGLELIERVTGAPLHPGSESLDITKLTNAEVVTKTKIVYNENQLLQLISDHLTKKGFHLTVQCLQNEMQDKNNVGNAQKFSPIPPASNGSLMQHRRLPWSLLRSQVRPIENSSMKSSPSSSPVLCSVSVIPPPSVPLKIKKRILSPNFKSPWIRLQKLQMCSGSYVQSPALAKRQVSATSSQPTNSLDSIVTEYLRKQHSMCKNPVFACPPFDLFEPHKCPEPQNKKNAPVNCVLRLQNREISFQNGGYQGAALNTKHIYSRFRIYRTFHGEDNGHDLTCCRFYNFKGSLDKRLIIGTENGKIQVLNVSNGKQILSHDCHVRGIAHMETSKNTPLFITSDGGRIGNSCLWKFTEATELDCVQNFYEISHLEFGKSSLDKLIATNHYGALLLDANTFTDIRSFRTECQGNNYEKNRATLDFFDELVLSDGLIFDVRSARMVHKLDKFNSLMNGVFHPNGREIISNSEIWDIRTFKLLRTVAGLHACKITFNDLGNVIYAGHNEEYYSLSAPREDSFTHGKMNCFNTFDAHNYNIISTVDVKRKVYDIATDEHDRYLSTIEGINSMEFICRIYEVGRSKQMGDESGDESEDTSDGDDEDDDDDSDENEGQANEVQFDVDADVNEEDDDDDENDLSWMASSSSEDDNEALFALNTSSIDD